MKIHRLIINALWNRSRLKHHRSDSQRLVLPSVNMLAHLEVKKILAILDEPNQKDLESMLDDNLDGIMTKLRAEMPNTAEKDFRFIAFLILGFDTKTIARMMGYNVSTVYTKRHNIKDKIAKLDSKHQNLFSGLIS